MLEAPWIKWVVNRVIDLVVNVIVVDHLLKNGICRLTNHIQIYGIRLDKGTTCAKITAGTASGCPSKLVCQDVQDKGGEKAKYY